jgi:hypothetical protein
MSSEILNGLNSKFTSRVMKDLVGFSTSFVQASMGVDIDDSNAEDIESNNTPVGCLNGTIIPAMTADAAAIIDNMKQGTIWLTAQSYTGTAAAARMMRFVEDPNGLVQQYICILDHTSSALNKPGVASGEWETYWKKSSSTAENAVGDVVTTAYSIYYLITAESNGELSIWKAGPQQLDGAEVLIIPNFEPELFIPVSILHINSATFTLGTTALTGIDTHTNLIGPIFPGVVNRDIN